MSDQQPAAAVVDHELDAHQHQTVSPGWALHVRSPTVTSIGTSRTCHISPRWS